LGGIPFLEKLKFLGLFGNLLNDINECIEVLKMSPNLNELIINGNPLCVNASYRNSIINILPKLKWLDWEYVHQKEK